MLNVAVREPWLLIVEYICVCVCLCILYEAGVYERFKNLLLNIYFLGM